MKKKTYKAPHAEVFTLRIKHTILAGSDITFSASNTDTGEHVADSRESDSDNLWDDDTDE